MQKVGFDVQLEGRKTVHLADAAGCEFSVGIFGRPAALEIFCENSQNGSRKGGKFSDILISSRTRKMEGRTIEGEFRFWVQGLQSHPLLVKSRPAAFEFETRPQ
jgi:hypothetical protein